MPENPLTDTEQVRLLMQSDDPGDEAQDLLDHLVDVASRMIRSETRRRFTAPRELAVARRFTVYSTGTLYLDDITDEDDVLSVSGPVGPLVRDTDYEVRPETYPTLGCYLYFYGDSWPDVSAYGDSYSDWFTRNLTAPPYLANRSWRGKRVAVTANWGTDEVPEGVNYLAARTVAVWWKSDIAHFASTYSEVEGRFVEPDRLPPVVLSDLKRNWKAPQPTLAAMGA